MKMYDYLIAYTFRAEGYLTPGHGTIYISRINKIKTFDDINEITDIIRGKITGVQTISIDNFILLGRNKH